MWLPYGIDEQGELVHIEDVRRGKTALGCPYCGGALSARKGRQKAPHFAHTHQTCRAVDRHDVPTLPFYDRFDLGLSQRAIAVLHEQWEHNGVHGRRVEAFGSGQDRRAYAALRTSGCWEHNPYQGRYGGWVFTNLGKIPVGALSMRLFADAQDERLLLKLWRLEQGLQWGKREADREQAAVDLCLYQHQYHRILSATLYLLSIRAGDLTLHKIGVTRRPMEERLLEVERELRDVLSHPKVQVVDTWAHRGGVERYFKYRYRASRYPELGSLTEYFQFEHLGAVTRDLRRMKPKTWDDKEREILEQRYLQADRSHAIRAGMQRVAAKGTHIGRPRGTESAQVFLNKPSSRRVIAALAKGLSLRQTAAQSQVAVGTVRKVKALVQENQRDRLTS